MTSENDTVVTEFNSLENDIKNGITDEIKEEIKDKIKSENSTSRDVSVEQYDEEIKGVAFAKNKINNSVYAYIENIVFNAQRDPIDRTEYIYFWDKYRTYIAPVTEFIKDFELLNKGNGSDFTEHLLTLQKELLSENVDDNTESNVNDNKFIE